MNKLIKILTLMLVLIFAANLFGGDARRLFQNIPTQIQDWKVSGEDHVYDRKTIFKHINGGAELYLAYDFKQAFVRKYAGPGDTEIVLDIYDMGSSAEAFGIFSSEREEKEAGIGQGSEYADGLLRFHKDRFFVSILAIGDSDAAEPVILELGKAAAKAIPGSGPEPGLLRLLPAKNLDKSRIRYFHTPLLLNKHYYVADENILFLNSQTDCLLAEYSPGKAGDEPVFLLLVRYPNKTDAGKAYENFLKFYMPGAVKTGLAQKENKKWTMAGQAGNMVIIVFDAPDRNRAGELIAAVEPVK